MSSSPPPMGDARRVEVSIDMLLRVTGATDEKQIKPAVVYGGEVYQWRLQPIVEEGISTPDPTFQTVVHISSNAVSREKHRNTLAARPPDLIKLDCGYWGSYWRDRKAEDFNLSRDFGMIQGQDVWLCRFHSDIPEDTKNQFWEHIKNLPGGDSPARKFMTALKDKGFCCQLVSHAFAHSQPGVPARARDELIVIFPDLHLPERWPDEPDEKKFCHPDADARDFLRDQLIQIQHAAGWKMLSKMNSATQKIFQDWLEAYIDNGSEDPITIKKPGWVYGNTAFTFTRPQFLAELAFVDRWIKAKSTWFYQCDPLPDEDQPGRAEADASPAVDLINMLAVLRDLKKQGTKLQVIQLGDLYEMWMGREFLYYFFPKRKGEDLGDTAKSALNLISSQPSGIKEYGISKMAKVFQAGGVGDKLQFRRDAGWRNPSDAAAKGFKHYVFDPVEHWELLERHETGTYKPEEADHLKGVDLYSWIGVNCSLFAERKHPKGMEVTVPQESLADIGKGVVGRLQALLRQRRVNVENFCLPLPDETRNSVKQLHSIKSAGGQELLGEHRRPDKFDADEHDWSCPQHVKRDEYCFNRMILELFKELDFKNIHGNHDGYRSDPLFRGVMGSSAALEFSPPDPENGIWYEHSHRWESYNRDGVTFGAGMTNLVYYHNAAMVSIDSAWIMSKVDDPHEQSMFQPGAAQWFLLANFRHRPNSGEFEGRTVPRFNIYVGGHTHNPDLVRLVFKQKPGPKAETPPKPPTMFDPGQILAK